MTCCPDGEIGRLEQHRRLLAGGPEGASPCMPARAVRWRHPGAAPGRPDHEAPTPARPRPAHATAGDTPRRNRSTTYKMMPRCSAAQEVTAKAKVLDAHADVVHATWAPRVSSRITSRWRSAGLGSEAPGTDRVLSFRDARSPSTRQLHEALNMTPLELAVVFVCEKTYGCPSVDQAASSQNMRPGVRL